MKLFKRTPDPVVLDWMSQVNQISDKCQESWRTMVDAVGPLYGRASAAKASGQERLAASAAEVNAASDALEGFAQSVRRLESEFKTLIPPTACSNSAKAKYADCLGWFKFLSQGLDTPLLGLTGEDRLSRGPEVDKLNAFVSGMNLLSMCISDRWSLP